MKKHQRGLNKVAFYGKFDATNFGNESTLQAILFNLRRFNPDVEAICISPTPEATAAAHHIEAVHVGRRLMPWWAPRHPAMRMLRKISVGLLSEIYNWLDGVRRLKDADMLIIPGTGLLTDAYCFFSWGPYSQFKWSVIAKVCRCKIMLVSIGAGPIYTGVGRWLIKSVLTIADFRSYRDNSTVQFLKSIGVRVDSDRVYPDLAFSLPEAVVPSHRGGEGRRRVVGVGLMDYAGRYIDAVPTDVMHRAYLDNLTQFVEWLIAHGYDARLLIGDLWDIRALQDFENLLRHRLSPSELEHIAASPISTVDDLLSEIVTTDVVVATRFHNVVLSLLCNKPTISISFHHKCASLMEAMGLSDYVVDFSEFKVARLIEKFRNLEAEAPQLKRTIKKRAREFREALDEQYRLIFGPGVSAKSLEKVRENQAQHRAARREDATARCYSGMLLGAAESCGEAKGPIG